MTNIHDYLFIDVADILQKSIEMTKRHLYDWEQKEIQLVFSSCVDYNRIVIYEGVRWTNTIDNISRMLLFLPPRNFNQQTAMAIGFNCFFPVKLPKFCSKNEYFTIYISWLIHEVTHVWQFQCMGWKYLYHAMMEHILYREYVYDYGGIDGLINDRKRGKKLMDYNLEQQASILQDTYLNLMQSYCNDIWRQIILDLEC